ncbi:amino acid starvation-responsive transcription factor GCN4 [Sugiyamaella lignohabitans]|uniref:Amino acid starvation-responsive transcription factor GCN4 n=1 Tax=Sugiyamaella lignohabitans TaxID=796027 RepID=A0A167FWA8_9ASCO|nr:amino acid starvation-responsive transcription factor GCN4 [Sugiyamaella lignohabitans]ANB15782.1 amino acid starvation-responsive transcription factor GCN4 [Sugiyamaella lignohabitans]
MGLLSDVNRDNTPALLCDEFLIFPDDNDNTFVTCSAPVSCEESPSSCSPVTLVAPSSTSTFVASEFSTPDMVNPVVNSIPRMLDQNAKLLASTMFDIDEKSASAESEWSPLFDTSDKTSPLPESQSGSKPWSPLFKPADITSPVPKIEVSFTCEKRSAIVMAGDDDSFELSHKRMKISSSSDVKPIIVKNPSDPASVRRARNTEAARRSRAKKNARIDHLEAIVAELQSRNSMLEAENNVLRRLQNLPPSSNI